MKRILRRSRPHLVEGDSVDVTCSAPGVQYIAPKLRPPQLLDARRGRLLSTALEQLQQRLFAGHQREDIMPGTGG